MLVATLGHIIEEGVRRWLRATTAADRDRNAAWVAEGVGDPVTRETVALITTVATEVNAGASAAIRRAAAARGPE